MTGLTPKWDARFLRIAREVSTWSKDPSTQVGAVIVAPDRSIVSTGYNGLPRGVPDDPAILDDRERKLTCILHAEENAILKAGRHAAGCSIYIHPFPPCGHCASLVIQSGIKRVVSPAIELPERWADQFRAANDMMTAAGIEVVRTAIAGNAPNREQAFLQVLSRHRKLMQLLSYMGD